MSLSNNDIMWDCFVDILRGKPSLTTSLKVVDFITSYEKHSGKEVEFNFSHDNWTLVCCWLHFFKKPKRSVPSFGHHALHPSRFFRFLWMKYSFFYPLRVFSTIDMIVRHGIIRRKTHTGQYHTSGLLLDYYIHYSYKNTIQMWILDKLRGTMFDSWEEVFAIYHNHPDRDNYKVYTTFLEEVNNEFI